MISFNIKLIKILYLNMLSLYNKTSSLFSLSSLSLGLLMKTSSVSLTNCNTIISAPSFKFSIRKGSKAKMEKNKNIVNLREHLELKKQYEEQLKKTDQFKLKFEQMRKIYLDMVQEMEHMKKRHIKEVNNVKEFAISKFAKDLLEVHDNFERAMSIVKNMDDNDIDKDQMMSSFIEGIQKVNSCLNKIFKKNGVVEYKPKENEKFDPMHHDAVFKYEDKNGKNGTIGKILFSGFKIGNRILRPAKVGVIKNNKI